MRTESGGASAATGRSAAAPGREWTSFLVLAAVGLPLAMTLGIAAYGFVVWILQVLFFGPPS